MYMYTSNIIKQFSIDEMPRKSHQQEIKVPVCRVLKKTLLLTLHVHSPCYAIIVDDEWFPPHESRKFHCPKPWKIFQKHILSRRNVAVFEIELSNTGTSWNITGTSTKQWVPATSDLRTGPQDRSCETWPLLGGKSMWRSPRRGVISENVKF